MPRSYQRLKTMVKTSSGSESEGSQFLWHERTEPWKEHRRAEPKRNQSALKGRRLLSEEANGKCTKGDACSFHHDSKRGKSTCSSSSTPESQTKNRWEKLFERQASQRDQFHRVRGSWRRVRITMRWSQSGGRCGADNRRNCPDVAWNGDGPHGRWEGPHWRNLESKDARGTLHACTPRCNREWRRPRPRWEKPNSCWARAWETATLVLDEAETEKAALEHLRKREQDTLVRCETPHSWVVYVVLDATTGRIVSIELVWWSPVGHATTASAGASKCSKVKRFGGMLS